MRALVCLLSAVLLSGSAFAQQRVMPGNTRERVLCVVPLVGAGTWADPKRPLFAPNPGEASPITGYSWQPSDDGRFAIVEFVAAHPKDFADLLADARVAKAFRKGMHKSADIERELKKYRKDWRFETLPGGRP